MATDEYFHKGLHEMISQYCAKLQDEMWNLQCRFNRYVIPINIHNLEIVNYVFLRQEPTCVIIVSFFFHNLLKTNHLFGGSIIESGTNWFIYHLLYSLRILFGQKGISVALNNLIIPIRILYYWKTYWISFPLKISVELFPWDSLLGLLS